MPYFSLLPLVNELGTLDWGEIMKSLEKVAVFVK